MKRNDMVLAAAVLLIAGVLLLLQKTMFLPMQDGKVVLYREKEQIGAYPLSIDQEIEIAAPEGGRNLLIIHDGKAWIGAADCPDRLCMQQGKIAGEGQSLICLPHKLSVVIEGGKREGPDAVTG